MENEYKRKINTDYSKQIEHLKVKNKQLELDKNLILGIFGMYLLSKSIPKEVPENIVISTKNNYEISLNTEEKYIKMLVTDTIDYNVMKLELDLDQVQKLINGLNNLKDLIK